MYERQMNNHLGVTDMDFILFVFLVGSDGAQFFLSWSGSAERVELQTDAQWLCDTQTAEPEQEVGTGLSTRSGEMQVNTLFSQYMHIRMQSTVHLYLVYVCV